MAVVAVAVVHIRQPTAPQRRAQLVQRHAAARGQDRANVAAHHAEVLGHEEEAELGRVGRDEGRRDVPAHLSLSHTNTRALRHTEDTLSLSLPRDHSRDEWGRR